MIMKPNLGIQKLKPLLSAPSFTSAEAKNLGVSSEAIAYYVRIGSIERIARGLYRGVSARASDDFRWEDLAAAVKQTKGGVICLTSALAIYELTEEIPRKHWIAVKNTTRHRAGPSVKVIRFRNLKLGKTTIKIEGERLPIFDRERTIVDAFRQLGLETAVKALKVGVNQKGKNKISLTKLQDYAKKLRVNIGPYLMAVTA